MMVTVFRCWWQNHYVGDFFPYVGDFLNVLNWSPTSWIGHQNLKLVTNTFGLQHPSPTSMLPDSWTTDYLQWYNWEFSYKIRAFITSKNVSCICFSQLLKFFKSKNFHFVQCHVTIIKQLFKQHFHIVCNIEITQKGILITWNKFVCIYDTLNTISVLLGQWQLIRFLMELHVM